MTPPTHDDTSALLGPAALGLLTVPEQAQLDAHLASCARCRDELAALTGTAGRLGELDGQDALLADLGRTGPDPSVQRVDGILAAVAAARAAEQRRGRQWQAVLASAASAAVLASGLVTATALSRDDAAQVPLEAVAVQAGAGVQASADLVAHTWGVEIKLAATGLADGEPFTVQVRTDDGETVDAGAFLGTGERRLLCNLNASVLRPDATAFTVLDASGAQVLTARL